MDRACLADKSRAQDVKLAVQALKDKGAAQATTFPKDHRPWGWFESLVVGGRTHTYVRAQRGLRWRHSLL